jgi:hypothetical protein
VTPAGAWGGRRQYSLSGMIRLMFGFAIFFFMVSTPVGRMLLTLVVLLYMIVVPFLVLLLPVIGICLVVADRVGAYVANRRRDVADDNEL